jgi:NAD-dependent deacetylase
MSESIPSIPRGSRVVVLTGAGISVPSGLPTYRGKGGLWEGHSLQQVACPEAWRRDPEMVLRFYNHRRDGVRKAQPNAAHVAIAKLEEHFDVQIITQNIDDLHERAGSRKILHLHGEILKARSSCDPALILELGNQNITLGDRCPRGSQLRPHVVWFGESVPNWDAAAKLTQLADVFLVVGTSLAVYPAALLIHETPAHATRMLIDPEAGGFFDGDFTILKEDASIALPRLVDSWIKC